MLSKDNAICGACSSKTSTMPGICMPIQAGTLEQFLGHEVFECDKCHQQWKVAPNTTEPYRTETPRMLGHGF